MQDTERSIAKPAYDLGILMRKWIEELIEDPVQNSLARSAYLHFLTGVDRQAIREWASFNVFLPGSS